MIVTLKRLLSLDKQDILYHERVNNGYNNNNNSTNNGVLQVSAKNRYSPSIDLLASQNHMENVVKAIKKQTRLNFR